MKHSLRYNDLLSNLNGSRNAEYLKLTRRPFDLRICMTRTKGMDHAEEFVQGHGLGNYRKETSMFYA